MIKNNILVGITRKVRTEKNKNLKKYGLAVQDVFVPSERKTYGIAKDFVPLSQYSLVEDSNGQIRQIHSFSDEKGYMDKDSVIENPKSFCIEIPENSIVFGFVRTTKTYQVFVPIVALIEDGLELKLYNFSKKEFGEEVYTNPRVAMIESMTNFNTIKSLILKKYSSSYKIKKTAKKDEEIRFV